VRVMDILTAFFQVKTLAVQLATHVLKALRQQ
jgi:hypothetical protein